MNTNQNSPPKRGNLILSKAANVSNQQLGEGPTQQRVFTPRRWGISVIESGDFQ